MDTAEAELEDFRAQWKAEVNKRSTRTAQHRRTNRDESEQGPAGQWNSSSGGGDKKPPTATYKPADHGYEDVDSGSYHDLEEGDGGGRRLNETEHEAARHREPQSALEHYEKAVEREAQGNLGDSVRLYRRAFKLDQEVHEQYKNKHFAEAWAKGAKARPRPAPPTVNAGPSPPTAAVAKSDGPQSTSSLIASFSQLAIQGGEAPTDLSPVPPCPISSLPEELLAEILLHTALADITSFSRMALVCRRLAYLVATEDRIWKRLACGDEYGFAAMRYRFACTVRGTPISSGTPGIAADDDDLFETNSIPRMLNLPLSDAYRTYRHMLKHRPRIRFNGCYISTVNYVRPGGASSNQTNNTWLSQVLIVTYYRYLRFFRDGSAVSLLTTAEPRDVVHHLTRENVHKRDYPSGLPGACMKDALSGRWRLSGPSPEFAAAHGCPSGASSLLAGNEPAAEAEAEGDLHVETEGVVSKYTYRMHLGFGSAGSRAGKNNKLVWKGYWSYNRLTDDWAEFGLRNDRAFYWSRVKSYGTGL